MPVATEEETVAPVIAVEPEPAPRTTGPAPTESAPTEVAGGGRCRGPAGGGHDEPAAATIEPARRRPLRTRRSPGLAEADTEVAEGIARLGEGDALLAALALRARSAHDPRFRARRARCPRRRRDLALELVRGDALRLLGQESDAGQAYSSVASALSEARSASQPAVEETAGPPAMQQAGEPSDLPERPTETAPSGAPPESPVPRGSSPRTATSDHLVGLGLSGSEAIEPRATACRGAVRPGGPPPPATLPIVSIDRRGIRTVTERTLVLVKPDGVQRQLAGRIIARFEERGLKIVGLKLVQVDRDLAERHYAVHKGKPFFEGLVAFITSSPLVAIASRGTERDRPGADDGRRHEAGRGGPGHDSRRPGRSRWART